MRLLPWQHQGLWIFLDSAEKGRVPWGTALPGEPTKRGEFPDEGIREGRRVASSASLSSCSLLARSLPCKIGRPCQGEARPKGQGAQPVVAEPTTAKALEAVGAEMTPPGPAGSADPP
jgi:hypothetical protein